MIDHAEFEVRQRRTATAMLPLLLSRCKSVLTGYLASASLRGSYPFERVREEELAYIVRRLLDLKLWSGSFDSMQATGKLIACFIKAFSLPKLIRGISWTLLK